MAGFGIAVLVLIVVLALLGIAGTSLLVVAIAKLVRGRPSGSLGVLFLALACASVAYAVFAGTSEHLVASEWRNHVWRPLIAALLIAPLGLAHVLHARRARERAFLDAGS
jgi:cytochrome bd-type quinol oxidase subunit 2